MAEAAQTPVDQRRERRRAQWRAQYHRHKHRRAEVLKDRGRKKYWANRQRVLNQIHEHRKAHPYSSWTEAQKERHRIRRRKWSQLNGEKQREVWRKSARKRFADAPDKVREVQRKRYRAHPEIRQASSAKRRALKAKAAINLNQITAWMAAIKAKPFVRCYYCDSKVSTNHIHFDHMIPLSRGGPHSIENLCVSCVLCNLTKKARTVEEWQRSGQQVLGL
jgi:5-methylcytosine-specific restriction endonuclease McrA